MAWGAGREDSWSSDAIAFLLALYVTLSDSTRYQLFRSISTV